jgi:hypothetical protein
MLRLNPWLLLLACVPLFATAQTAPVCAPSDMKCLDKAVREHAVTRLAYWQLAFAKPVEERIGAAPPELVDYVTLQNMRDGFPNRPRAAAMTPAFVADLRAAFVELPPQVKHLLSPKLAGLYVMDDLGGSGYTDYIYDAQSRPVAGFSAFDRAFLEPRTANEWATWKENTPFRPQAGWRLVETIEDSAQDNRKNAIQYILLHELGHELSIGGNFHPRWDVEPKDAGSAADYPYFALSWTIAKDEKHYPTRFDAMFPERKDVVYYFGAKLPADQMLSIYSKLEHTNFATLYSVNHPGDDFAEAFANYVHVVLMKKPFRITIYHDGKIVKVYSSCWAEARCAEKRKILEQLLLVN